MFYPPQKKRKKEKRDKLRPSGKKGKRKRKSKQRTYIFLFLFPTLYTFSLTPIYNHNNKTSIHKTKSRPLLLSTTLLSTLPPLHTHTPLRVIYKTSTKSQGRKRAEAKQQTPSFDKTPAAGRNTEGRKKKEEKNTAIP